jgi:opacity protein-like surface antigen
MALTLAIAGTAQSAMWVGAQIGANFAANTDVKLDVNGSNFLTFNSAAVEPAVIAGITIGYNFVREGFLGYNWPDWMKYFSFATDFTFNRYDMRKQSLNGTVFGVPFTAGTLPRGEGTIAAWTFLFMGGYPLFPDSEVPGGRVVPYLGVGPGIVFSSLNVGSAHNSQAFISVEQSASSVDIALVAEAGVRFMALKNVSLDVAFRYRWCQPTYSYGSVGGGTNVNIGVDANQFSALCRASYHF